MTQCIVEEANSTSLLLVSPTSVEHRGGSVMFRLPDGTDSGAVLQAMADREIMVDCRGAILRISPGAMTKAQHVDRLIEGLQDLFPKL